MKNVLVTGGAGFIGSNFIRFLLEGDASFSGRVVNLDALTYAGNLASLEGLDGDPRYSFEMGDVCDRAFVEKVFGKHGIDTVVHFAAESHVDRSILGPEAFVKTNVMGTHVLLDAARGAWAGREDVLFHHVSTDEVYGSLGGTGYFTEGTAYDPRSPYSASKAGGDHLAKAYWHTYGLPVTVSNCSNNYGPRQFPEKLVPLMILNMLEGKPLPVYGDGRNVRDWLFVDDHNRAIWAIAQKGGLGETYNIGGDNELENVALLKALIRIVSDKAGLVYDDVLKTINFVKDRPGHDRRYAIDCSKIKRELGWGPSVSFEEGMGRTVDWYLGNRQWVASILSGEYRQWVERNYADRA